MRHSPFYAYLGIYLLIFIPQNVDSSAKGAVFSTALADTVTTCSSSSTIESCSNSLLLKADRYYIENDYEIVWPNGSNEESYTVTESGDYVVEYRHKSIDMVKDGSFSSNQGALINSDYNHNPWGVYGEGTYAVTDDASKVHNRFRSFKDHTKDSPGYMMVINGSSKLDAKVWYQEISVLPNTCYNFSIWAATANDPSPAQLKFLIDDTELGAINLDLNYGEWRSFNTIWHSGNKTKILIAIINKNTAASGNDFALDDISFTPYIKHTYHVTLQNGHTPDKPLIKPDY